MSWALEEMQSAELGDERLNKRLIKVLDSFGSKPEASIPQTFEDWSETKAAYRFFDNKKVTLEKILSPHNKRTIERIQQEKCVLMLQDTTEVNYTGQEEKEDVGPSHFANESVFFLHPTLVVTPDKRCLGISDIYYWHREQLQRETHSANERETLRLHHQHISEKESYRWLLGYRHATEIAKQCSDTHVVMVADRESDIADIYDEAWNTEGCKADWLIRAKITNRVLLNSEGERDKVLLRDKILEQKPVSQIEFLLPRRDKKPERKVTQEIRALRVQVHPPTGRRGKLRLRPFWLTAILAQEINPPKDEEPIEWLLLTSVELNDEVQAHTIIQWYLCRWQIEIFFSILKGGCNVEKIQLTAAHRFMPCIALYCIVAWRILLLTQLSRIEPHLACEPLFEKSEWQCAYMHVYKKPPPKNSITLSEMILLVARLGGFLARKSDKNPGVKTIWRGLRRLSDFVECHKIIYELNHDTCG